MRKEKPTVPAQTVDSSQLQTIRQIASQARAFYLKEQTQASKPSPVPFDQLDKNRAYEYAKRAAERLGIDDDELIAQASALVHLSPKEWDARFGNLKPHPKPQQNTSNAPSPFEQQLEKTRREASLTQGSLVPSRRKLFEGSALENAPGIKDLTDVPNETDLAAAAGYWGLRKYLQQKYGSANLAPGWGKHVQQLDDDELRSYVGGSALAIGGRELDEREMRAALNTIRLMAQNPPKDWDTLVGNGEKWEKRIGDATRTAQRERRKRVGDNRGS